jgi:hypothetical protein
MELGYLSFHEIPVRTVEDGQEVCLKIPKVEIKLEYEQKLREYYHDAWAISDVDVNVCVVLVNEISVHAQKETF